MGRCIGNSVIYVLTTPSSNQLISSLQKLLTHWHSLLTTIPWRRDSQRPTNFRSHTTFPPTPCALAYLLGGQCGRAAVSPVIAAIGPVIDSVTPAVCLERLGRDGVSVLCGSKAPFPSPQLTTSPLQPSSQNTQETEQPKGRTHSQVLEKP